MRFILTISLTLLSLQNFAQDFSKDTTILRIEKLLSQEDKAQAYNLSSEIAWYERNFKEALEYSKRGLKIAKANELKSIESELHNNRGITYEYLSQYSSAMKHYFAALAIQEKLHNPEMKAEILGNIGLIYLNQGQESKSLNYHRRALKIWKSINDLEGMATSLNNIAVTYTQQGRPEKAIEEYQSCIKIDSTIDNIEGLGYSYNNIGRAYIEMKEYKLALNNLERALKIRKTLGTLAPIAVTYANFGEAHFKLKNYDEASRYFDQSIEIASQINHRECLKFVYNWYSKNEVEAGDSSAAFRYYELYISYSDSIDNSTIARKQTELELNYKFNKEKEVARLKQREKDRQNSIILIAISSGLLLILLFSILFFRKWRQTRAQQLIIEEKNELVQHKNDEILASISYAERIQSAILPSTSSLNESFPSNFVLYLPKDIVSGDFYLMDEINDARLLAVADCTGHGVPGAMVSVVCFNAFNRSIREFGMMQPKNILNKTRELVIESFSNNKSEIKDGMDIALCSIKGETLTFSGANNPLWIVRKNTFLTNTQKEARSTVLGENESLIEFKSNKQPIGAFENMKSFDQVEIELFEGDTLYLFTDGFADQFGGPKGKKFMYKPLKRLIISIYDQNMEDQKNALNEVFMSWKGDQEQVDDVCMIGMKF